MRGDHLAQGVIMRLPDLARISLLMAAGFVLAGHAYGAEVKMKNVLMIVSEERFRDEEYFTPKMALEMKGINVLTASASLKTATGVLGGKVSPDLLIDAADMKDYDALVLVGGGGAEQYYDDPAVHKLVRQAADQEKIIAAICIAPVILARAGVLKGKKATVWYSDGDEINTAGGEYTAADVQVDGNIITANGPQAAQGFTVKLLDQLLR